MRWLVALALGCGDPGAYPPSDTDTTPPTPTVDDTGTPDTGTPADTGTPPMPGHLTWTDGPDTVTVDVDDPSSETRTYTLSSTHPMRDGGPSTRTFTEPIDQPALRSGNLLLDALFALAVVEARENAVEGVADGAFGGTPVPCHCYETGELWSWVWTRDTAYAADLGLAWLDAERARDSLLFKLSEPKGGGTPQIVQDTGSGGSWPVSTDRAIWALGARKVLAVLPAAERDAFRDAMWPALVETIEVDRAAVYDARDGLYRGEQSFLDWREQSYPSWVANDVAHIAMSKALSTNVAHHVLLSLAAELAGELGDTAAAARYGGWASNLAADVDAALWMGDGWATFATTTLDPAPLDKRDWLGTALAALELGHDGHADQALAAYPHGPYGPPVLWPQQPFVPIYHNRAIWPFVTAYGLKAAAARGNDAVYDAAVSSLLRGAAVNLSHMENLEFQTGANWVDDGVYSGPVVNSRRQLWSVAAMVSLVTDGLFGLRPGAAGLEVVPFVTPELRNTWLAGADELALLRVPFRGAAVDVHVALPPVGVTSVLEVGSTNGMRVTLVEGSAPSGVRTDAVDDGDWRKLWSPKEPRFGLQGDTLRFDSDGEQGVVFDVFRDGVRVDEGVTGPTWSDGGSGTRCYSVASVFESSGHVSQHAPPLCVWTGVHSIAADAFVVNGGTWADTHGRWHYDDWGAPGHTLRAAFTAVRTGPHLVQAVYGNGGPVSTGVTCGTKWVQVRDAGGLVGGGLMVMPHLGDWGLWADSTFVEVELEAGKTYELRLVDAPNMSALEHFAAYTGPGGGPAASNFVNISELKVLER